MTYFLATHGEDGEIEVDFYHSETIARTALMLDLYENYQDLDLPKDSSDEAISKFLCENDIHFSYRIGKVSVGA